MYQISASASAANPETAIWREEIRLLEQRLRSMGEDGDCAYERAMSCLYRAIVAERKRQLTLLGLSSDI
jgi:hypothetical protein